MTKSRRTRASADVSKDNLRVRRLSADMCAFFARTHISPSEYNRHTGVVIIITIIINYPHNQFYNCWYYAAVDFIFNSNYGCAILHRDANGVLCSSYPIHIYRRFKG